MFINSLRNIETKNTIEKGRINRGKVNTNGYLFFSQIMHTLYHQVMRCLSHPPIMTGDKWKLEQLSRQRGNRSHLKVS